MVINLDPVLTFKSELLAFPLVAQLVLLPPFYFPFSSVILQLLSSNNTL
jgi:hypothetical protein